MLILWEFQKKNDLILFVKTEANGKREKQLNLPRVNSEITADETNKTNQMNKEHIVKENITLRELG